MTGYEGHTPGDTNTSTARALPFPPPGEDALDAYADQVDRLLTRVEALEKGLRRIAAREGIVTGRDVEHHTTFSRLMSLDDAAEIARHLLNNGNGQTE